MRNLIALVLIAIFQSAAAHASSVDCETYDPETGGYQVSIEDGFHTARLYYQGKQIEQLACAASRTEIKCAQGSQRLVLSAKAQAGHIYSVKIFKVTASGYEFVMALPCNN